MFSRLWRIGFNTDLLKVQISSLTPKVEPKTRKQSTISTQAPVSKSRTLKFACLSAKLQSLSVLETLPDKQVSYIDRMLIYCPNFLPFCLNCTWPIGANRHHKLPRQPDLLGWFLLETAGKRWLWKLQMVCVWNLIDAWQAVLFKFQWAIWRMRQFNAFLSSISSASS